jgi:undecaprenyl diphosphate synthase
MNIENKKLPRHIAIIMDGNRRWAKKQGLRTVMGHDYVAEKVLEPIVDRCIALKIPYVTFWAFSTENWERERHEVKGMMKIFRKGLRRSAERLFEKGVKLRIIGDIDAFPSDISEQAKEWVEKSKENQAITVCFALNYGGRDELLRAVGKLLAEIQNSKFKIQNLDENTFSQLLDTVGVPDPDLIIRTGGEQRLSGFMSWQSAYSELYFTKVLMPDFTAEELDKAISEYQKRSRRFGR